MKFDAILLDIEGTTTPVQFVYDVLFPYAREHLADYVEKHWSDIDVAAFRAQAEQDRQAGLDVPEIPPADAQKAVIASALLQMDGDRKVGALKSLQGKIWEDGYHAGGLKGQLFADVKAALERWKAEGIPVYIYSSGSVLAQKLIFGFSEAGDLKPLLSGYFDTEVGAKREAESYRKIASQIGVDPARCVFATDILQEAQAAREAGWQAVVMDRPGNAPQAEHDFPTLKDFATL